MFRSAAPAALLAALLGAATPAAATSARGIWWEITTEAEMKGMPFAMPATTVKVCAPEGEPAMSEDQGPNCSMTVLQRSAGSMRWKVTCTGKDEMEGVGESSWTADASKGTITIHSRQGDMVMKQRGRRLGGDCSPKAIQAEQQAKNDALRKEMEARRKESEAERARADHARCRDAVKYVRAGDFDGKHGCQEDAARADLCARLATREGFTAATQKSITGEGNLEKAGALCRVDVAGVQRRLCEGAQKDGDLSWLRAHCPAEVRVLVKRECAGRDYTSTAERYRDFCADAAAEAMKGPSATGAVDPVGRAGKGKGKARAPEEDGKAKKEGKAGEDPLEKGRSLLKGVLGF